MNVNPDITVCIVTCNQQRYIEQCLTSVIAQDVSARMEILATNPLVELSRICQWLGVAFVADMLEFQRYNAALRLQPGKTMPWKEKTLRPVQEMSVGAR